MIKIKCYGKINLSLNILGRRNDNYHLIDSVMTGVDLYDIVTAKKRADNKVQIKFIGEGSEGIGFNNTVKKAVDLLKNEFGDFGGVDIVVEKNLGVGGGLGGSGANVAGTIKAVNELYNLFEGEERFYKLSGKLGSDAKFMAMLIEKGHEFCARVLGVGELIEPIDNRLKMNILIEKGSGVSSKDAYEMFDRLYPNFVFAPSDNDRLIECLKIGNNSAVEYMFNALEKASLKLMPKIEDRQKKLFKQGAKKVLIAGSGGSVWGVM